MVLACLGGALYQSLHFTVNIMTKMNETYDDLDQDVFHLIVFKSLLAVYQYVNGVLTLVYLFDFLSQV